MISPGNHNEFEPPGHAERRESIARMQFERLKVTIAAIVTIIVTLGFVIFAKWPRW
jgi:hypothetical protein